MLRIPPSTPFVDDEATDTTWVLSVGSGRIFGLNSISALIWENADGASDSAEVVTKLCAAFGWQPDVIGNAVDKAVAELIELGVLGEMEQA